MLPHLAARDVTLTAISRAPFGEIARFKRRMGWHFNWVSSAGSDFNFDFHVSFTPEEIAAQRCEYNYEVGGVPVEELPGISVFFKDDTGGVFHTYSCYARGSEELMGTYLALDLMPKGRDEDGLAFSMSWVRHHDRYTSHSAVDTSALYSPPKGSCCHQERQ